MNPADILKMLENPLGFDSFNPGMSPEQKAALAEQEEATFRLAQDFHQTFGSAHGKRVLNHLNEKTIESSTWCASLGLDKGVPHGFAREGQNAFMRYIKDMIKAAEQRKIQLKQEAEANAKSSQA